MRFKEGFGAGAFLTKAGAFSRGRRSGMTAKLGRRLLIVFLKKRGFRLFLAE